MNYKDISDNPKRGWKFGSDLEMQKSAAKMAEVFGVLELRKAIGQDLFRKKQKEVLEFGKTVTRKVWDWDIVALFNKTILELILIINKLKRAYGNS